MMIARRHVLLLGGAVAMARATSSAADAQAVIRMRSDPDGSLVGFDPIGLLIQPGTTVRFHCEANYHTTTAYHPANANHSLRIPDAAQPWSSDVLQPGDCFEVTLTVPGVYDYFCAPHEAAGMVGRLIVGQPAGPGSLAFDWYAGRAEAKDWVPVPAAARAAFPAIADIMRRGQVPAKLEMTMADGPERSTNRPGTCVARP
jgi:plastocyanin